MTVWRRSGGAEHDFTVTDVLMPHPVYGDYGWVCVLNPDRTWPTVKTPLASAHDFAVRRHENTATRCPITHDSVRSGFG